jgi:hypothetical protein
MSLVHKRLKYILRRKFFLLIYLRSFENPELKDILRSSFTNTFITFENPEDSHKLTSPNVLQGSFWFLVFCAVAAEEWGSHSEVAKLILGVQLTLCLILLS